MLIPTIKSKDKPTALQEMRSGGAEVALKTWVPTASALHTCMFKTLQKVTTWEQNFMKP